MLTKRLSTIITACREAVYGRFPLRCLCYLAVIAALLFHWLYAGGDEVAFVYNNF